MRRLLPRIRRGGSGEKARVGGANRVGIINYNFFINYLVFSSNTLYLYVRSVFFEKRDRI